MAAVSLAVPVAAWAEGETLQDGVQDVWEDFDTQPAPGFFPNVDLESTRVRHMRDAVRVKATYTQLQKNDESFEIILFIKAQPGEKELESGAYNADLTAGPSNRNGTFSVNGDGSGCDGVAHKIDYVANTISMEIPRSCIGTPRWVRYDAQTSVVRPGSGSESVETRYYDDARSTQAPDLNFSTRLPWRGLDR